MAAPAQPAAAGAAGGGPSLGKPAGDAEGNLFPVSCGRACRVPPGLVLLELLRPRTVHLQLLSRQARVLGCMHPAQARRIRVCLVLPVRRRMIPTGCRRHRRRSMPRRTRSRPRRVFTRSCVRSIRRHPPYEWLAPRSSMRVHAFDHACGDVRCLHICFSAFGVPRISSQTACV